MMELQCSDEPVVPADRARPTRLFDEDPLDLAPPAADALAVASRAAQPTVGPSHVTHDPVRPAAHLLLLARPIAPASRAGRLEAVEREPVPHGRRTAIDRRGDLGDG